MFDIVLVKNFMRAMIFCGLPKFNSSVTDIFKITVATTYFVWIYQ